MNPRYHDFENPLDRVIAWEDHRAAVARVTPPEQRPADMLDEQLAAIKLGTFAKQLIDTRNYYLKRETGEAPFCMSDNDELRQLSKLAADCLGPVIAAAVNAKALHDARVAEIKIGAAA